MLNVPYQSTPLSSETKSSDIYIVHRFKNQPTHGDTRRRPSDRTATRRKCPGEASHDVHTPTCLPDQFASSIFISIASTASSDRAQRPPLLPSELRHRRARAPPQKRELRLHHNSVVSSSTFSTS